MRYLWTGLIGLGVAAATLVSTALVVRYLPSTPEQSAVETETSTPSEETTAAASEKPVDTSAAEADRLAESETSTASVALPRNESSAPSVSSDAAEGEQVIAEFVPTIPPPVPPAEPLEIIPGGILNFRSLPPEALAQEKPAQPAAPEASAALAGRATNVRLRLTAEQAEKVRDVLLSHTILQSELEFPLRVGGTVPANIGLTPLPREVAGAVPDYTNYSYVFTQNQLVIVVTTSREIDLLIPA
jgi:hypothetical protein